MRKRCQFWHNKDDDYAKLTDKELITDYLSGHCVAWPALAGNFERSKIMSLEDLGKQKSTQEMPVGEPIIGPAGGGPPLRSDI